MTEREGIILTLDAGIPAELIPVRARLLRAIINCELCGQDNEGVCWAHHRLALRDAGLRVEDMQR